MKNLTGTTHSSKDRHGWHVLDAVWHWLIKPSPSIVEPERRLQARLLMAMLLVLMVLGLFSLPLSFFGSNTADGSKRVISLFFWITAAGILLLVVEYGLSRTVHYPLAAVLTVGTILSVTFASVIVNPHDLTSTSYLILAGLIGSLFLPVRTTVFVFFVTFLGLLLLPAFDADFSISNTANALFFIVTVGVLVVMATILRQRYLETIERQTRQLIESEARLRELSIRDPLTGLFNRRYLEEVLEREMIRATRKQFTIGVIMADIDHFKRFNDDHGHAAGDAVLVEVGKWLQTHIRASDVACRYGGEEFVLILPEASLAITKTRAGNMLDDIRRIHVEHAGQTLEAVTLSVGVAIFPDHGSTIDAVLDAADTAMYRAKRDGRDGVAIAE